MNADVQRPSREVEAVLDWVVDWARGCDDIRGLLLVGSYARDAVGIESDVGLVILSNAPETYRVNDPWWHSPLPQARLMREQRWGPVTEYRLRLPGGLLVEFGITTPAWAGLPLDPATYRVLADGARALHDPDHLVSTALHAAHTTRWRQVDRADAELAVLEVNDPSAVACPVVLVHGLAGHAGEWLPTVASPPALGGWALDVRGHGYSTRRPAELSEKALVEDVAAVIRAVTDRPVCLVGQSLGGVLALRVAARHPHLVAALALIDTGPARPSPAETQLLQESLHSWPRPFATREDAVAFFGGGLRGHTWAAGMDPTPRGWWPRFDVDVLTRIVTARAEAWADWEEIGCLTRVLRAERDSLLDQDTADRMQRTGPRPLVTTVPGSGHDIHLDRPDAVARTIRALTGD